MFVPVTMDEAKELEASVLDLVRRVDPDAIPSVDAPAMYGMFDRIVRSATAARTLLARRVEDSRVWESAGHRNAAEHLAAATGTTLGAARTELETSRVLPALPIVAEALRDGTLSAAQGAVVADAAKVSRQSEATLIEAAGRTNLLELREEAGRVKAAADPDPEITHARIHRNRRLSRFADGEGGFNLTARGTPDAGAEINAALDPIIDELVRRNRDGEHLSRDAYAFDALVELARRWRGQGGRKPNGKHKATNPRFLGLLRIDLEALRRGRVEGDELCEITGVGPVPVPVARGLLGEAVLKLVITKGVDVCNVTSLGRGPTAAMKVALAWTSPTCTVEGCSRTHTEYDHRVEWRETHHTRLDETEPLCDGHHDKKTNEGWALVEGTGKRPMVPPGDPRHPRQANAAIAEPLEPQTVETMRTTAARGALVALQALA